MIGTLAGFRAHATERGNAAPGAATDPDATAALVRASDYLRAHYRGAVNDERAELEECAYLVAAVELATPGAMGKAYTPGERKVLTQVNGIRWQVLADGSGRSYPVLTLVDGLLGPSRYLGVFAV